MQYFGFNLKSLIKKCPENVVMSNDEISPIDLKAAVSSRSASRALSRLSNGESNLREVVGSNDFARQRLSQKGETGKSGAHRHTGSTPEHTVAQRSVTSGTPGFSPAPSSAIDSDGYKNSENDVDRRITDHLLLGATAAAMGAVVHVFKGRGGKATLAAWNKVAVAVVGKLPSSLPEAQRCR